ncbi:MAG: hypothetical protein HYZ48_05855, partial [Chlamydiales bacterium]|nr:hypothetical protein [Chlamydiales bacterium]
MTPISNTHPPSRAYLRAHSGTSLKGEPSQHFSRDQACAPTDCKVYGLVIGGRLL